MDSGLDVSSLGFVLEDEYGLRIDVPVASYDAATGVARTAAISLAPGAPYRLEVQATDILGNVAIFQHGALVDGGGFLVTDLVAESTQADISGVGGLTGETGQSPGTLQWAFLPKLVIDTRVLNFVYGSRHPGWGTMANHIPLDGVVIEARADAGDWQVSSIQPYGPGTSRTVYQQVAYLDSSGITTQVTLPPHGVYLEHLTVDLPEDVVEARLKGTSIGSVASPAGTVASPATLESRHGPDPLRVYLEGEYADEVAASPRLLPVEEPEPGTGTVYEQLGLLVAAPPVDPETTDLVWQTLLPLQSACGPTADPSLGWGTGPLSVICFHEQVGYPPSPGILPPDLFRELCDISVTCAASHGDETSIRRWKCVDRVTGRDKPWITDPEWQRECTQAFVLEAWVSPSGDASSGNPKYLMFAGWSSEWGVDDGPRNEIGLHHSTWDNRMLWRVAQPGDVPGGVIFAARHDGFSTGVYPQSSQTGHPTAAALQAWEDCFVDTDGGAVPVRARVETDGNGESSHGVGTGYVTDPSQRGWPQFKIYSCNGNTARIRARFAEMYIYWEQLDSCVTAGGPGTPRRCVGHHEDGHLVMTWGHQKTTYPYIWTFFYEAVACAAAPPRCNPAGLIFTDAFQPVHNEDVSEKDIAWAFEYD